MFLDVTLPESKKSLLYSNINLSKSTLTYIGIFLSQLSVQFQSKISLILFIIFFVYVYLTRPKRMARKVLMEGLPENAPHLEEPFPICLLTKATKVPIFTTTDVLKPPPGFMLQMNLEFFNV